MWWVHRNTCIRWGTHIIEYGLTLLESLAVLVSCLSNSLDLTARTHSRRYVNGNAWNTCWARFSPQTQTLTKITLDGDTRWMKITTEIEINWDWNEFYLDVLLFCALIRQYHLDKQSKHKNLLKCWVMKGNQHNFKWY